jgi:indolepyruvate ferredoxin oxidoreductase
MNAPEVPSAAPGLIRRRASLEDALFAKSGTIFLSGIQALVRLPLMQRELDEARGLGTAGFVSGYRGSPLGGYDKQLWAAAEALGRSNVHFLPAINEELAATAVLGSQQVESDPARTRRAAFGLWYGKGPGVDRAADALKHGHARGASPNGGVLVVAGDDHGCVSSSMGHQSELTMMSWRMPVLSPANVAELLEFGLHGWALSRHSGAWVGMTAISEVVESAATVNLDALELPVDVPCRGAGEGSRLHYRSDDRPGLAIEARMAARLDAVREFAAAHPIDRMICAPPGASLGIVTCGKAHPDLLEALRRIGLGLDDLARAGVRLYKVGLAFPIEPARMRAFARGLAEVLVVEEKGSVVEQQMRALLYGAPPGFRPAILGKTSTDGRPLLPEVDELRPSRLLPVLTEWLARHRPALDRRSLVAGLLASPLSPHPADHWRRAPHFCSGCPHNTSTVVPAGSRAQSGIGCHAMAMWMDRDTAGVTQMGGEGVDWLAHSRFTATPHVFQNLGDGTWLHSGVLAVRQAVAAKGRITFKILVNDAVAMTGGQPPDGVATADAIARQLRAEGVARIAVVAEEPDELAPAKPGFPPGVSFHPRAALDAIQRELRELPGVSALIYVQVCAAEKRRRRRRGEHPAAQSRLIINEAVCDGCGECGRISNCLSVVPVDTPAGRKRRIDQSSCNMDLRCADAFCPSFVSVRGARLRRPGRSIDRERLAQRLAALPQAGPPASQGPYDLLVAGVGGTGVVTVGALVAMAAHLEARHASVLDFTGFAQKGGSVLSHVRIAANAGALNQARIDARQADAVLACDLVVAAGDDALQTVSRGRTRIVANLAAAPIAAQLKDPDADMPLSALLDKLAKAVGGARPDLCDARAIAEAALGDAMAANVVMLGFAWQRGIVPVGWEAIEKAIELNRVALDSNLLAFRLGRVAAADPAWLDEALGRPVPVARHARCEVEDDIPLDALLARLESELVAYQDARLASRWRSLVDRTVALEIRLRAPGEALVLAPVVARSYARLSMYKDEYEVARLHASDDFRRAIEAQFEGHFSLALHLAPPLLARPGRDGPPRKLRLGAWAFPLLGALAALRRLRGTAVDPFGHTRERRIERALPVDYAAMIEGLLDRLSDLAAASSDRLGLDEPMALAVELASLPRSIRGYGQVKLRNLVAAKRRERELLGRLGLDQPVSRPVERLIAESA